jgi:hypothetical protein
LQILASGDCGFECSCRNQSPHDATVLIPSHPATQGF